MSNLGTLTRKRNAEKPGWFTLSHAAEYVGVSIASIDYGYKTGKISVLPQGGFRLYSYPDLKKWKEQRNTALPEVPSEIEGIGPVMTSQDASHYLGVPAVRIREYISHGRITFAKKMYARARNNRCCHITLVPRAEIEAIKKSREDRGIPSDLGPSLGLDDSCPYPMEELISASEAAEVLGITTANLAAYRQSGRFRFDIRLPMRGSGRSFRVYYRRKEIMKVKEERDTLQAARDNPDWLDWRGLEQFTGMTVNQLKYCLKKNDLPSRVFARGKQEYKFFWKPDIVVWLDKKNSVHLDYDGLMNTNQVIALTGFGGNTISQHLKAGTLKYKHRRMKPIRFPFTDKNSPDGRGYWFEEKEVVRWKDWMWDRLFTSRSWRGRILHNLHTKNLEEGKEVEITLPYQDIVTVETRLTEVVRTPRIADPEKRESYYKDLVSSGEISIELAEALEAQIVEILKADSSPLSPHDLYQLIMGFKHVKDQYSILKERKIKVPENCGRDLAQALPLVTERARAIVKSGLPMSADDTYYLTQVGKYVQMELLKRDTLEVVDTGEDADDLFAIVDGMGVN